MKILGLGALVGAVLVSSAHAATLTLPSITVTSAASTAITCTPPSGLSLVAPLAANTVVDNCTVVPAGWTGAVALAGGVSGQFVVTALSGNTFNVAVGANALAAGTYNPGTLTTTP